MRIALFIPCYIDQLFPHVGIATLRLLQQQGLTAEVLERQLCCGQPFTNAGATGCAQPLLEEFAESFAQFDAVICPSGSCVSMVRNHYPKQLRDRIQIFELCEFLHDQLPSHTGKSFVVAHPFPHQVALHSGCHGLRELSLGKCSELGGAPREGKVESLLARVPGLRLVRPKRTDECCGFGGTFAVMEPEVSCSMGRSRLDEFAAAGAEVVTSADMSCLMHLDGLVRRENRPMRMFHVAEIFAGLATSAEAKR